MAANNGKMTYDATSSGLLRAATARCHYVFTIPWEDLFVCGRMTECFKQGMTGNGKNNKEKKTVWRNNQWSSFHLQVTFSTLMAEFAK